MTLASDLDLTGRRILVTGAANGFGAAMVVYAVRNVGPVPDISWPRWAADRQAAGTRVRTGEPLCTVLANDISPTLAEAAVRERAVRIRTMLEGDAR